MSAQPVELREVLAARLQRCNAAQSQRHDERSRWEGQTTVCQPPTLPFAPKETERDDGASHRDTIQSTTLSEKLKQHLGLGERPELRMALYLRCERLAAQHGERFYQLVREALTLARGARSPGHYFCRAIRAKINEAGFLEDLT